MINDATLMEWELTPSPNGYVQHAVAEIRRLQEKAEIFQKARDEYFNDLTAHQAVVRELAEEAEYYLATVSGTGSFFHHRSKIKQLLAHPLVQQTREEKA